MGLFNKQSTEHKLEMLQSKFEELERRFRTVEQEWDATADRVAKTLRRIKRAEQAALAAEDPQPDDTQQTLPLTTVPVASDRLAKIREQLAAKGR